MEVHCYYHLLLTPINLLLKNKQTETPPTNDFYISICHWEISCTGRFRAIVLWWLFSSFPLLAFSVCFIVWSSWLSAHCEHLLKLTSILALGFKAGGFEFQKHTSHVLSGGRLTPAFRALDTFDQNRSHLFWVLIWLDCGCGSSQKRAAILWFSRGPLGCTSRKNRQHIKPRFVQLSRCPQSEPGKAPTTSPFVFSYCQCSKPGTENKSNSSYVGGCVLISLLLKQPPTAFAVS